MRAPATTAHDPSSALRRASATSASASPGSGSGAASTRCRSCSVSSVTTSAARRCRSCRWAGVNVACTASRTNGPAKLSVSRPCPAAGPRSPAAYASSSAPTGSPTSPRRAASASTGFGPRTAAASTRARQEAEHARREISTRLCTEPGTGSRICQSDHREGGVSRRISSRCRGFPAVCSQRRRATGSGRSTAATRAARSRTCSGVRGCTRTCSADRCSRMSAAPASPPPSGPVPRARSSRNCAPCSRATAETTACSDAGSACWASSIVTTRGFSRADSSQPRASAAPTVAASHPPVSRSDPTSAPSATISRPSSAPAQERSHGRPLTTTAVTSGWRWRNRRSSVDFPIPAGPSRTATVTSPVHARSSRASSSVNAAEVPISRTSSSGCTTSDCRGVAPVSGSPTHADGAPGLAPRRSPGAKPGPRPRGSDVFPHGES